VALGDAGVNAFLIVRTVARDRRHGPCDLVEQGIGLGAVIHVVGGQRRGHDLAGVGIHAQVQLSPRPARAGAVLLDQPLARTAEFQASAVHQQVHGLGARARPRHLQRRRPAAEGGMVGHLQRQAEQADDRTDQPLGLPVGEAEHGAQGQRRQDRQMA
jgi:hypothetical protein